MFKSRDAPNVIKLQIVRTIPRFLCCKLINMCYFSFFLVAFINFIAYIRHSFKKTQIISIFS